MPNQRIDSLDLLRGFAILGILLMNVQSFGLPSAAYINPLALGDPSATDHAIWTGLHLFADMKFMNLFSMLFGVGVVIFGERAAQKGTHPLSLHRSRMVWLIFFGVVHAYAIWWGDILFTYAVCGLLFPSLLPLSNKRMLAIAAAFFVIGAALLVAMNTLTLEHMHEDAVQFWRPTQTMIDAELSQQTGSWVSRTVSRAEIAFALQMSLPFFTYWRVTALMLVGVVLYRIGFLSAKLSVRVYVWVGVPAVLFGVLLTSLGTWFNVKLGYSLEQSFVYGATFNYFGSIVTSLGFAAFIMLLAKSSKFMALKRALRSVGKTAFTNYIMQSLFGLVFFCLLGYFGKLGYAQLMIYVLCMWALQIVASTLWLSKFKQGPLEALWRGLTYRGNQNSETTLG